MAQKHTVKVLETHRVSPPPGTASELSLPLTFSDMMWMVLPSPIQRLIFYEYPTVESNFMEEIIPGLKNSLSVALRYFPALAGKLVIHPGSTRPEIRYQIGDSVPLMVNVSNHNDFYYLVSDEPRSCSLLYPLVAQLEKSLKSPLDGTIKVPLLALQVTLFPGSGFCIGISNQHVAGDGSAMYGFMKVWIQISKLGEESAPIPDSSLPVYDRDVMKATKEIDGAFWNFVKIRLDNNEIDFDRDLALPYNTDKVRATFVVGKHDVQRLKDYVSGQNSGLKHLSTFTVVCGYVWICMVIAENAISEAAQDDEIEYFGFVADSRGRTDPPIPANYFGNCLTYCLISAKNKELTGEGGLQMVAEKTGEAIRQRLYSNEGPFHGIGAVFSDVAQIDMKRTLSIAGSPRQNYYEMDFGWGKPRKFEFVSIDMTGAISLSAARDLGGIEVGLSLPKRKMDAFMTFFEEGLKALENSSKSVHSS